ncbi:hypothetical protein ACFLR1_01365 [Bacteroidota bacterium]
MKRGNSLKFIVIFFIGSVFISSCSAGRKVFLTSELKQKIEAADIPHQQIQFYNSEDIILVRKRKKEDVILEKGQVTFEKDNGLEEVIIPAMTPGVCKNFGPNFLVVAFESGDNKEIIFELNHRNGKSRRSDRFRLSPSKNHTDEQENKNRQLDYNGKDYFINTGISSHLLIVNTVLHERERDTNIAKGQKL